MGSIKLVMKKLGPIKNSEIELGDVTLFMGPPNTGKSYALKALYSTLLPLDAYSFDTVVRITKNNTSKDFLERYFEKLTRLSDILEDVLIKVLMALTIAGIKELDLETLEEVFESLQGEPFEKTITLMGNEIIVTIPIELSVDESELEKAKRLCVREVVKDLILINDLENIALEPFDFERVKIPVEDLAERVRAIGDVSKELRGAAILLLTKFLEYYIRKGVVKADRLKTLLQAYIDEIKAEFNASVTIRGKNASIVLTLSIGPIMHGTSRGDAKAVLEELFEIERTLGDEEKNSLIPLMIKLGTGILEALGEGYATHVGKMIKEIIETSLGFEEVRFIPFMRSPVVSAIEIALKEPFEKAPILEELLKLYPINMDSYVYWASVGRILLMKNDLDETKEKILTLAIPLMEGKLINERRKVFYEDWRGSKVNLRFASDSVKEVIGMLFPILSLSSNNTLILVEEPEAQLHPQAQVVSALFLASLPSLCCKVVATTHSDLIAITLSYLVVKEPSAEQIMKLLRNLIPHVSYNVEELAKQASQSIKDLDLRIYEFTRDGSVKPVEPETVLSKEVPSITRVIDVLTEWAFELTR